MNGDEFSATSESAAGHQIYSNLFKFRGVSTQRSCLDEIMTHLSALQLLHGATTNGSLAIRVPAQALAACKRRSALASRCLVAISLRAWQLKITSIPRMTSSATAAAASASRGPTSLIGTQLSPQTAPSLIFGRFTARVRKLDLAGLSQVRTLSIASFMDSSVTSGAQATTLQATEESSGRSLCHHRRRQGSRTVFRSSEKTFATCRAATTCLDPFRILYQMSVYGVGTKRCLRLPFSRGMQSRRRQDS